MRSLERPDSLGKQFHSSRRISFFLFSIVPLWCLPLLPPLHPCPQASFALGQRQLLDAAHAVPLGRQESKGPAEGPPGCWGTLAAARGSALPLWLWEGGGHRAAPGSLWPASSLSHPMVGWQGQQFYPFPPLGHLFGTVKSAQHGRPENLYILPPKIWKSLKMEVFRVRMYPKISLADISCTSSCQDCNEVGFASPL